MSGPPGPPTADVVAAAWERLESVHDPELPVSVVAMGLIRGIALDGARLRVELTFTSMGCPWKEWIERDVREALLSLPGIEEVEIEHVWARPWTRGDLRDDARRELRLVGISS